jgi:PleD family two-component response regulator
MLAVLSLPVIAAWTLFTGGVPLRVAQFRELVTLGTMLVMTLLVLAKQHQLRAELANANHVLQEVSVTDPLTGTRNRRFFDVTISADTSQVLRSYAAGQRPRTGNLIFYVVDVDDFKAVNDHYGHNVGDKVLVEIARRINSVIRK